MLLPIVLTIILSALGAVLYRLGGAAKEGNWYDFLCQTKTRDFGVPFMMVLIMLVWGQYQNWQTFLGLFLSFGCLFGAQTTYWDFVNKWIGQSEDEKWWNWALTGFGYSLALLPLVVAQNWPGLEPGSFQTHYSGFLVRLVVVSAATALWSEFVGNAVVEENGRGAIELASLPLLFIG